MTKHEFLNRFSNELNRRGVADAEDIVEEYAQHFAFKQADGYSEEEIAAAFRPNTKLLFGETITNPGVEVLDIEKFARIAHNHGVPLIVDNTFATPINCRPFEWGADIVVHSATKFIGGTVTSSGLFFGR